MKQVIQSVKAGLVALVLMGAVAAWGNDDPLPFDQQLARESSDRLARDARDKGDATRGAILFHQPHLTCTRCHTAGERDKSLGPDLAQYDAPVADSHLVESLLAPSKSIRKGFQTLTLITDVGQSFTGFLVKEGADSIVIRDVSHDGQLLLLDTDTIDERSESGPSIMPEGLVNLLGGRQEFLDLVRYLMEIAEHGPERARELRPAASMFALPPVAEYERDLDHAGLIAALDEQSIERGRAVYERTCIQCHGTRERPGSLPTSLRFASGKFKNGSDPFRMYQTLTHGYGLMTPQPWLVPRQKYDVIHYIRETWLKTDNPSQYALVDADYLRGLPAGSNHGPEPRTLEPWSAMDYGPSLIGTYEIGEGNGNIAYKGIAVRLDAGPGGVAQGRHWIVYDHDTLRVAGIWSGQGFMDFNGIQFNGAHQVHPHVVGTIHLAGAAGPGWANPENGGFQDPRPRGRDGKCYGPLPRRWAHYRGIYHFGQQTILSYTVGDADVLELPGFEWTMSTADAAVNPSDRVAYTRTFYIGPSEHDLLARVAPEGIAVAVVPDGSASLVASDGQTLLHVPARPKPLAVKVLIHDGHPSELTDYARSATPPLSLVPMAKGGPPRWSEVLHTRPLLGSDDRALAVDVLTHPENNPWLCQMRFGGLDFLPDGKHAAICTWDGDVWLVGGIDGAADEITWRRIASGLFQPLGLKVVGGRIYVSCRDQIVVLHDLNGDHETDYYENFNSDHQVTEHFHEFAMGLQTDAKGNFYYAKSARHALPAIVPHHGTLLRVSPDGLRTDILATGFRAANGVCVNPDGTFFVTDQEGHWNPKNRINWVKEGGFYGNMFGYHDVVDSSDSAMQPPLCWITNAFDRSPAELLWVESPSWGPLNGGLLNLSYGYGKVFVVLHERLQGQIQGGMCELPLPQFPTGLIRGRFNPADGHLYVCGLYSWAGSQTQPGGFYRIRATGKPLYVPVALRARPRGLALTFAEKLDPASAADPAHYSVRTWGLKRTENYGSEHYDERSLWVAAATLKSDGRTVYLTIPKIAPTWCMEIRYDIQAASGASVQGTIHNTIHKLPKG